MNNNIELIISGNLTGFSHFYDSPVAKELNAQAKIDFDYRNYIKFLNAGGKLYSVSFAPKVIALSLVTRILDSFRRPGILVISILMPRNKKVESVVTGDSDHAAYDLLNAVNDKFYERNFINGMINQNTAVLMQDYYTDILAGYRLVDDPTQRNVCMTVDPTLANKRSGYVKAVETDIASYLATPCRKSYEGYNDVFFAVNAPQNIEEPPVEVVLYNVRITNNGQRISGVRLTDKVHNLLPDKEKGEEDIYKDYTYQQVLNGEAGGDIVANMVGDSIEITYRFKLEERTINFVFRDGNNVLPFENVMPVFVMDGVEYNIPSESYTFKGKEIYGVKHLKSIYPNIAFKPSVLDISRIPDGGKCTILVEQSTPIKCTFNAPYDKPKTITLHRNDGTVQTFNDVTSVLNASIPGHCEEYSYTITSDYYETVTGQLEQFQNKIHVTLVAKKQTKQEISPIVNRPQTESRQKLSNKPGKKEKKDSDIPAVITPMTKDNSIKLNGQNVATNNNGKKNSSNKLIIIAASIVAVAVLAVVGFFTVKDNMTDEDVVADETQHIVTKELYVLIKDSNGKLLTYSKYDKIKNYLTVEGFWGNDTLNVIPKDNGNVMFKTKIEIDTTNEHALEEKVMFTATLKKGNKEYNGESDKKTIKQLNVQDTIYIKLLTDFEHEKPGGNINGEAKQKTAEPENPQKQSDDSDYYNNKNFLKNNVRKGEEISYGGKSDKIKKIVKAYNNKREAATNDEAIQKFRELVRDCDNWISLGNKLGIK